MGWLRDDLSLRPECIGDAELGFGELRAKTTSEPEPSRSSSCVSLIASSSVPLITCIPSAPMPTRRAIAAAVSPLSPVTTWTRMPARCTRSIARGHFWPRRVEHRHQPHQGQFPLRIVAPDRDRRRPWQHPVRHRKDAQALPRVFLHDAAHLVAVGGSDRWLALAAADLRGPGEHLLGRALGVHYQAAVLLIHGRHQLQPGVEAEQGPAPRFPAGQRHVQATTAWPVPQGQFGRVTGWAAGAAGGQLGVVAGGRDPGEQAGTSRRALDSSRVRGPVSGRGGF